MDLGYLIAMCLTHLFTPKPPCSHVCILQDPPAQAPPSVDSGLPPAAAMPVPGVGLLAASSAAPAPKSAHPSGDPSSATTEQQVGVPDVHVPH